MAENGFHFGREGIRPYVEVPERLKEGLQNLKSFLEAVALLSSLIALLAGPPYNVLGVALSIATAISIREIDVRSFDTIDNLAHLLIEATTDDVLRINTSRGYTLDIRLLNQPLYDRQPLLGTGFDELTADFELTAESFAQVMAHHGLPDSSRSKRTNRLVLRRSHGPAWEPWTLTQPFTLSFQTASMEGPPASPFRIQSPIKLGYPTDVMRIGGASRSEWDYNRPGEHLQEQEFD